MRILFFPATAMILGSLTAWSFADQITIPEDYDAIVDWLRSHGDYAWLVALGVIMGDIFLPLPSAPAMFAMGVIYGPFWGALIGGVGMAGAGLAGYFIIRMLGRGAAIRILGHEELARTERFYERWGTIAVALGRAIGGPAEWAAILAGLSQMPFQRVLIAVLLGAFVSSGVIATLGALSVFRPEIAIGLVIVLVGSALLVTRWMKKQSEVPPPVSNEESGA